MNRHPLKRACLTLACSLIAALALLPLQGCKSGPLADMMNRSAMDMLAPMVKDAANSYINNLTALTSSLSDIRDLQGVMDFVQKAKPMADQLTSSYQTLSGTTGEERTNLLKAFGPKLDSANSAFLNRSSAIKGNGMWGQIASPVLDKVKLFQ